jgi:ProP effector
MASTEAITVRAILAERFPLAIKPKGADKSPLKIGVKQDVIARCPDLSKRQIRDALRDYTSGFLYLRALINGACRIDLDGQPAGEIAAEHRTGAQARLIKLQRRKAAQDAPPHEMQV